MRDCVWVRQVESVNEAAVMAALMVLTFWCAGRLRKRKYKMLLAGDVCSQEK